MEQRQKTTSTTRARSTRRSADSSASRSVRSVSRNNTASVSRSTATRRASSTTTSTIKRQNTRTISASSAGASAGPRKTNQSHSSLGFVIIVVLIALLAAGLIDHVINHDKAYAGVKIGTVDCGGKTVAEISTLLENTYGDGYVDKEVLVYVSDAAQKQVEATGISETGNEDKISVEEAREQRLLWSVTAEDLSASFNELATAQKAVEEAHGLYNIFSRLKMAFTGAQIDPVFDFGDSYNDFVDEVNATVGDERVDYDIWLDDGECYLYCGHDGLMVDETVFKKQLVKGFLSSNEDPYSFVAVPVETPVRITKDAAEAVVDQVNAAIADGANFLYENSGWNATPSTISEWINSRIEKQGDAWVLVPFVDPELARADLLDHVKTNGGEDAIQVQFSLSSSGEVIVHTDATGLIPMVDDAIADLDVALFGSSSQAAQEGAAAADGNAVTVSIASSSVPSEMSLDQAIHYGVVSEISSFTTSYTYGTTSTETRNYNIHLAADLLNNSICKAGGSWSFHETAGECNEENGFLEAGVIEEGVYSTSFGGGICQVATTVFNAVYDAGYYINRRHNHTIYNSSYPAGRDAAVSWPDLDLIWSNDTESDILVTTSHTEGTVTVTLWGVDPERVVSTYVSDFEEGEKFKTTYVLNESMAPTAYRIKTYGVDGCSIYVERTVRDKDGEQLSFQRFSSSYTPSAQVVEHGKDYKVPEDDDDEDKD